MSLPTFSQINMLANSVELSFFALKTTGKDGINGRLIEAVW